MFIKMLLKQPRPQLNLPKALITVLDDSVEFLQDEDLMELK